MADLTLILDAFMVLIEDLDRIGMPGDGPSLTDQDVKYVRRLGDVLTRHLDSDQHPVVEHVCVRRRAAASKALERFVLERQSGCEQATVVVRGGLHIDPQQLAVAWLGRRPGERANSCMF